MILAINRSIDRGDAKRHKLQHKTAQAAFERLGAPLQETLGRPVVLSAKLTKASRTARYFSAGNVEGHLRLHTEAR